MTFLNGITILLIFQLIGEISVLLLKIPVPGPVVGMMLLFMCLFIRDSYSDSMEPVSTSLLNHLSLLFVPAGVGIMVHYERIVDEWMSIGIALVLSTILTMAATAGIMLLLQKILVRRGRDNG